MFPPPAIESKTDTREKHYLEHPPQIFNRKAVYVIGSLIVVGLLAGLAYLLVQRADQKKRDQIAARRQQADKLQAVTNWQAISFDSALLGDCMDFSPCEARRQQADKLRAFANWQAISFDSPLLGDCMDFPPCKARRQQADKLRAIEATEAWGQIPLNSPLLGDCMGVSGCLKRRGEATEQNQNQLSRKGKVSDESTKTLDRQVKRF